MLRTSAVHVGGPPVLESGGGGGGGGVESRPASVEAASAAGFVVDESVGGTDESRVVGVVVDGAGAASAAGAPVTSWSSSLSGAARAHAARAIAVTTAPNEIHFDFIWLRSLWQMFTHQQRTRERFCRRWTYLGSSRRKRFPGRGAPS